MSHTLTTCTFCGVGCGLYLEAAGRTLTGAYPSRSHPANQGRLCVRGWHVNEVASAPDRLLRPLVRSNGDFHEVAWDEAFGLIADRLRKLRDRHGADALGFLNSPRCSNEESYLFQKLARALVGTNNVDHGMGAFRHASIDVLLEMLGVPATTNSLAELSESGAILVDGVDLGLQMPTVAGLVLRAKLNGAKLIVIDPRRQRLAEHADCFLQIRPGTDALIYGAMAKVIVDRGLMATKFIKAHCQDYEAFLDALHTYDLLWVAERCGVTPDEIETAAHLYAGAGAAASLFSTGLEARGGSGVRSLINLALLTGNLGKRGAGIFALAEHNNQQGVCDMGMLPTRLPGYRPVADADARLHLGWMWGAHLPERPGQDSAHLLAAGSAGTGKALWLCRHDPVMAAASDVRDLLRHFEFVVVQHPFFTESARYAHVVLPVAAYGEEQVTFTNTERRIQLAAQAVDPPAGLTPAWAQIARLGGLLGADWKYGTAADVMAEIGRAVPYYAGASYENLARDYGRQWPCTGDKPLGTRFLFEDGISGQPFHFATLPRPAEAPATSEAYPFALSFGHSLYYWHRNVLVQHSETLRREYQILLLDYPDGFVDVNADDARRLEIRDGAKVRLVAPQGAAVTTARVTREVKPGMIFVPFFLREVRAQLEGTPGVAAERGPVSVRLERV